MKSLVITLIIASLAACASSMEDLTRNNPIIDAKGVNLAQYNRDLSECEQYADEVEVAQKAAVGAVSGAVIGSVFGAVIGNGNTAQRGAGIGAVGGGARGVSDGIRERERVIKRCLMGRGYRVLN